MALDDACYTSTSTYLKISTKRMVIEPKDIHPDEQKERMIPTDCRGQRLVMVEVGYHVFHTIMPIEIYLVSTTLLYHSVVMAYCTDY